MKNYYTKSISSTLAVAFFTITIAALLIAGTIQIYIQATTSTRAVSTNQALIAKGAAESVANFIEQKFSIMETALSMGNWSTVNPKECQSILESLFGQDDSFRNLVCLGPTGKIKATVSRKSQILSGKFIQQIDQDLVSRFKQTQRYISPVNIDPETYEPLITLGMWITDILGDFKGILAIEVNLKFIWTLVDDLKIGETGQSYVVDVNGDLLAAKDITRVIRGENMAHISKVDEFIHQASSDHEIEASIFTGMHGAKVVGTAVGLGTPDWIVVTELPVKEAYRNVINSISISVISLLLIALASAWVGLLMARRLANPLIHLTKIASRIADGQQGLQAPEEGAREISVLAQSFNHMTGQLGQMLKKEEKRASELQREMDQRKQVEEKFRLYVENAHDGVLIVGSDSRFEYANAELSKILGYALDEIIGQPFTRFLDEDSVHLVTERHRLRQQGQAAPSRYEFAVIRKNGDKRDVEISVGMTKDSRGDTKTIGTLLDITDRKKAEQERGQAYKIINRSPYVAFLWKNEPGWPVEYVSKNVETLFGYSAEEFISGKALFIDTVHPDDLDRVTGEVRQNSDAIERTDFIHEPYRIVTKTGEVKWIHDLTHIRRDPQGVISHYEGIVYDITERKLAEEALRFTQFCFDKSAVGIYYMGSDYKILKVNEYAARMLGYSIEELCSKTSLDIDPFLSAEKRALLWKGLADVGWHVFETTHLRKDGSQVPVEVSSNLLNYGGQTYSIAFVQDISQLKKDEVELRQLRNYLSNIINSMPSTLVGVDRDCRVTQWNSNAEQTTGIDAATAHGETLSNILPWMASQMNKITDSIRTRQVIQEQKKVRQLEDGTRYEDLTIYPLVTNGVEGAVIRIDDVTEKVRLEEIMIQSEKMLTVGGLAAGMAHEINNPLAGMMQSAQVMASRLGNHFDIPANRKAAEAAGITMAAIASFMEARGIPRMLNNINESGSRMSAVVNNMLSFARKGNATVSSHRLEQLIEKTLALAAADYDLKKQYDFKTIEIIREFSDNLPSIPCESSKIQQVMLNILSNAAQAMQMAAIENPRITVRTRLEDARAMAVVEIEDNGPGMDEAIRKRVFEPFFTTKVKGVGTGLGLSVSYFIITENHGGELAVASQPGMGTKFIIRLPIEGKKNR